MPEHLLRRAGVYYYNRRVPGDVRTAFGKAVVKYSLKTSSLKEAKARLNVADVEWDAKFDHLRHGLEQLIAHGSSEIVLSNPVELVRRYVEEVTGRMVKRLENDQPETGGERAEMLKDVEIGLQSLREPGDVRADERILRLERQLLGEAGPASVGLTDQEAGSLLRRTLMEIDRRRLAVIAGENDRTFFDTLFDPQIPPPLTFAALAEEFMRYKTEEGKAFGHAEKSLDRQKASVKLVCEIIGGGTLVRDLGFDQCRAACSLLARVPSNRTKHYPKLSLEAAVLRGHQEGKKTLSFLSQQQYLATLKELLGLAVDKRLLPSNPAERLKPLVRDVLSAQEKRLPFTSEQLITFFQSDFYRTCSTLGGPPYRNAEKSWRFWLPHLMLFMGLRPREICQLQVRDLQKTKKGVWFIDIATTSDEDDLDNLPKKSLKTKASRRQVPLHPEVQRAGFVLFVEDRRSMKDDQRLFPKLATNQYGDPASYALKQFRDVYLPQAIQMKPRQAVYSFRHTWRDALRRSGASEDAVKSLGGWSEGTTTSDHYGSKLHPDLYEKDVSGVQYEALDLNHLHVKQ